VRCVSGIVALFAFFGVQSFGRCSVYRKNEAEPRAEQFLVAQGWDNYHDSFFTRAYVQHGAEKAALFLKKTLAWLFADLLDESI